MTFGNAAGISGVELVGLCAYEGCFTAALSILSLAEQLAKELSNTQPEMRIKFGTQERPNPQFQPAPARQEAWVPAARKNLERRNAWTRR